MDLRDIYRACHPMAPEYTFFSRAHETLFSGCHTLGHKVSCNQFKAEIIANTFSDHSSMKLEVDNRWKNKKFTNT